MSTSILRRSLTAVTFGGLLAVGTAPAAHASPAEDYAAVNAPIVCEVLDEFPTVPGVLGVVQAVMADGGFSPYDAGTVVATAVVGWCPKHIAELQRFVATYSDAGTVRA